MLAEGDKQAWDIFGQSIIVPTFVLEAQPAPFIVGELIKRGEKPYDMRVLAYNQAMKRLCGDACEIGNSLTNLGIPARYIQAFLTKIEPCFDHMTSVAFDYTTFTNHPMPKGMQFRIIGFSIKPTSVILNRCVGLVFVQKRNGQASALDNNLLSPETIELARKNGIDVSDACRGLMEHIKSHP